MGVHQSLVTLTKDNLDYCITSLLTGMKQLELLHGLSKTNLKLAHDIIIYKSPYGKDINLTEFLKISTKLKNYIEDQMYKLNRMIVTSVESLTTPKERNQGFLKEIEKFSDSNILNLEEIFDLKNGNIFNLIYIRNEEIIKK